MQLQKYNCQQYKAPAKPDTFPHLIAAKSSNRLRVSKSFAASLHAAVLGRSLAFGVLLLSRLDIRGGVTGKVRSPSRSTCRLLGVVGLAVRALEGGRASGVKGVASTTTASAVAGLL